MSRRQTHEKALSLDPDLFEKAWAYPNKLAKEMVALRRKVQPQGPMASAI